ATEGARGGLRGLRPVQPGVSGGGLHHDGRGPAGAGQRDVERPGADPPRGHDGLGRDERVPRRGRHRHPLTEQGEGARERMSLLIKNGEVVTAGGRVKADIYCEDEVITALGTGLDAPPGAEVIDARGKYVFPRFTDPHVHIYLPFMGTATNDPHATGSQAALVGGTTTYIEMLAPSRTEELRAC